MEKYKEVINKGNDNSAKCQQYLDGLLKIPFEIYKKEKIITFLNSYKKKLGIYINDIINDSSQTDGHLMLDNHNYNDITTLSTKYSDSKLTSENISI